MHWLWNVLIVWCAWYCWRLRGQVSELAKELREQRYAASRLKSVVDEERQLFQILRAHTAAIADGKKVPREQVLKGQFYSEISGTEAVERLAQQHALIDVRSSQEFMVDHAVGATLIPLDELPNRLGELPGKDAPVMLICASGGRSLQAAEYLASQGWSDVVSVKGGTGAWPGPHERKTMMKLNYAPPKPA